MSSRKPAVRKDETLEVQRQAFRLGGEELKHRDKEPRWGLTAAAFPEVSVLSWGRSGVLAQLPRSRLKCECTAVGCGQGVVPGLGALRHLWQHLTCWWEPIFFLLFPNIKCTLPFHFKWPFFGPHLSFALTLPINNKKKKVIEETKVIETKS